jgi:hypothetical protein
MAQDDPIVDIENLTFDEYIALSEDRQHEVWPLLSPEQQRSFREQESANRPA